MSAIDTEVEYTGSSNAVDTTLSDVMKGSSGSETYTLRKPKRVLHFSDGTLEEYDSDEEDGLEESHCIKSSTAADIESSPPVNPKTMPWSTWLHYQTTTAGQKTLGVLDSIGENIAYYLGITTPKYQYEIDEFKRTQEEAIAKKKSKDVELKSWATPSADSTGFQPIVDEIIQQPGSL